MIAVGTEAADWLNAHPQFASVAYRVEFEGSRMSAFLIRKEYERAIALWPQIEKGLTIGSGNWVGLLQIYFLVCLSGRRFSEARNALADYQSKFKSGGPAWRKQIFLLFRAYMLLLIDEALVEAGPISTTPRVYAGTLQKTCSNLLRDKPGTNAAIFILQIIQWLRAHNYSAVIDATERLRKYASRYLNATQTGRTGVFFRAISYIPVVDFDTTRAQERFDTLRSRHADAWTIDRDDAEIVPYEVLWDIIITALERNKGTKRR